MPNFTLPEKFQYLENKLKSAIDKVTTNKTKKLESLIEQYWIDYQQCLSKNDSEKQVIKLTSRFILAIEESGENETLIKLFKQHHIYEMIYHNPHRGRYSVTDYSSEHPAGVDILNKAKKGIMISAGITALFAIISLTGVTLLLPLATALFAASYVYMAGLTYGIVNDFYATNMNLPYFLLGHQPTQLSFFESNDFSVNAIGWGILATQMLSIIAATIFGVTVFFAGAPALFVLPVLLLAMPLVASLAECYAQYKVSQYKQFGIDIYGSKTFDRLNNISWPRLAGGLNSYQTDGLSELSNSDDMKARWFANSDRNLAGYLGMPLIAIGGLISVTTITALVAPAILFSPLFSIILPIVTAILAIGFLSACVSYALNNQSKQIDNATKLAPLKMARASSISIGLYIPEQGKVFDLHDLKVELETYLSEKSRLSFSSFSLCFMATDNEQKAELAAIRKVVKHLNGEKVTFTQKDKAAIEKSEFSERLKGVDINIMDESVAAHLSVAV